MRKIVMDSYLLAEVALEVANFYPDVYSDKMPRAEWRWKIVDKAIEIINSEGIIKETTDIDEIVENYLCKEEGFGE
jgi:hypothetical protein